jgi:hypothetical protein
MLRKPTPPNPKLVALLDERDELRVQLSLALDAKHLTESEVEATKLRLRHLEREIDVQRRFK